MMMELLTIFTMISHMNRRGEEDGEGMRGKEKKYEIKMQLLQSEHIKHMQINICF